MEVFTLTNGLTCVFEKRKDAGVVAVQVWVEVGSKFENGKNAGMTHFIEHLIFKGTEDVKANQMAARIEALGGSINAFTSYDNTVYHIVVPTRSFEEGLKLLVDAVVSPAFPQTEIEKEKKVVLEEIKMNDDDPQRKLFRELFSRSYRNHPYGRPIIGFEEVIATMTRQEIVAYFGDHYYAGNMVVVIVGDFDDAKARSFLAGLPGKKGGGKKVEKSSILPAQEEGRPVILKRQVKESYLAFSYPVPPMIHQDIPALDVVETILGNGDSSRLQVELKNRKGLVTGISTYLFAPKEEGLFVIYATFKGDVYEPIVTTVAGELTRLAGEGPGVWEIEKARNIIEAGYIYAEETVQGKARQVGNVQTLTGNPRFVDEYLKKIAAITPDDVKRVVRTYLLGKPEAVVVLVPEKKANPTMKTLKSGLRLTVNKNKDAPSFAFRVGFVGGLADEPDGKNGIFNLLSRMLLKGTKEKSAEQIAREIDLLAGDISPFNGKSIFGLSGKFLSKDMKKTLALLAELLTGSVMKEDELKKVKEDVLSAIRVRDDDPVPFTFRRFNEAIFAGHPYSRDPVGSEKDVESLTAAEIRACYRDYVTPANAVLSISGDVDEKDVEEELNRLLSGWSGKGHELKKSPVSPPAPRKLVLRRDIRQAHMVFGFAGPGLLGEDRFAAEVLDAILSGMGGRIHRVLREENPFAYATTFFNQMAYDAGSMGIYIGTDPKLAEKVEEIVRAEISKIVKEGFSDKEVGDAKNYLIGNHFIAIQTNGAKATGMCLDSIYGMGPGFFKVWPKRIENVSKDDVNRIAKRYLSLDHMIVVVVGGE